MSSGRVPSIHEPARLLNFLGRQVNRTLRSHERKLTGIRIGPAGELWLGIAGGADAAGLVWQRTTRSGIPVPTWGGELARVDASGEVPAELLSRVAEALGALPPEVFGFLAFAPPMRGKIPFDKAFSSALFGKTLAPGQTRWREWLCTEFSQSFLPASLTISWQRRAEVHRICLQPRWELAPQGEEPRFVVRSEDGSDGSAQPSPENDLARFVAFLVHRRLHPETPLVEVPELAPPDRGRARPEKEPVAWEWGGERGWRRFLHRPEVADLRAPRRRFHGPYVELLFGERECQTANPPAFSPTHGAYRFPALSAWPDTYRSHMLSAVISERELIMGTGTLLTEMFAAAEHLPGCRAIIAGETCISCLLGEDIGGLARKRRRLDGPIVVAETGHTVGVRNEPLFHSLLAPFKASAGPTRPDSVNLVGYLPGPAREELVHLLACCGITVNAAFLPDIDLASLAELPRAAVNVLLADEFRQDDYDNIADACGVANFAPPPPVGVTGTIAWLDSICRHVGSGGAAEEVVRRECRAELAVLDELRTRAGGRGILLVLSEFDVAALTDPSRLFGLPLVDWLEEMNWAPEFALHVAPDRPRRKVEPAEALRTRWPEVPVRTFSDRESLAARLAETTAPLVLSDTVCDERVLHAGKNGFGLDLFDCSVCGSVAALRRLVRRADNPFFARHKEAFQYADRERRP